jgi:hypothetical protein
MVLTFRGDLTMATLLSRLNLSSLRTLKAAITDRRDLGCLVACGSILSTVTSLILSGGCPFDSGMFRIFSLRLIVKTVGCCAVLSYSPPSPKAILGAMTEPETGLVSSQEVQLWLYFLFGFHPTCRSIVRCVCQILVQPLALRSTTYISDVRI